MKYRVKEAKIGDIIIGGEASVVVQSMTTATTTDIEATAEEAIRIYNAGAKLVRITTQGVKEAEALKDIKDFIYKKGYQFPISADIHFNYKAAYTAVKYAEKVRINPGNFVRHKDTETFEEGIQTIREKFIPLLDLCKKNKVALRIGVNHGSLSERMTMKYGDTPKGIVASCLEYLDICQEEDFHNIIISIKSSNTVLMVKAVRLLVEAFQERGVAYPLHLGVTEAGEGEDGRLKSAVGIGTLLNQGIGDTIRVSLTEPPECEPTVAQKIINFTERGNLSKHLKLDFGARKVVKCDDFNNSLSPRVLGDIRELETFSLEDLGYKNAEKTLRAYDYIITNVYRTDLPNDMKQIVPIAKYEEKGFPLFTMAEWQELSVESELLKFVQIEVDMLDKLPMFSNDDKVVLLVEANTEQEKVFKRLERFWERVEMLKLELPVGVFLEANTEVLEDFQIQVATTLGNSFIDKLASGVVLKNKKLSCTLQRETAFGLLQASRARTTKTEFISCPGCGRTLFDLQVVTGKVKEHFNHLNHLKVGVMGCIVNGPGEMGDAHYGYVGAGPGRITLYKGMEVMRRNVKSDEAINALEQLIRENGDWIEKDEE